MWYRPMYVLTYAIDLSFFAPPTGWIQNQGLRDGSQACWPPGLQQEADHEHKEIGQPVEMHDLCHVSCIQFFFSEQPAILRPWVRGEPYKAD